MSDVEEEASKRSYGRPYTAKHPVPTVRRYKESQNERAQQEHRVDEALSDDEQGQDERREPSKPKRAYAALKAIAQGEDPQEEGAEPPYPSSSRNDPDRPLRQDRTGGHDDDDDDKDDDRASVQSIPGVEAQDHEHDDTKNGTKTKEGPTAETAAFHPDPKQRRKNMKKIKRQGGGREVTDPVTHLPVMLRDMTDRDLARTAENEPGAGTHHRSKTGTTADDKSRDQLDAEQAELDRGTAGMRRLFPPPDLEDTKREIARVARAAMAAGLGVVAAIAGLALLAMAYCLQGGRGGQPARSTWLAEEEGRGRGTSWPWIWIALTLATAAALAAGATWVVCGWLSKRVESIFEDETWEADRDEETRTVASDAELPESTAWLNSLLASVWPLVNPDLFSSVADTLEDVMQASLPRVVRMVSVDDLGQGSEAVRILGVRWLPTGAAGQSVDADGRLRPSKGNDRAAAGEGQIEEGEENDDDEQTGDRGKQRQDDSQDQALREGMEAEEGDFVNLELAFAYRARSSSGRSIRSKAKNAHLYLKFYLPGGVALPVWVELRGLVGIARVRLQLAPDPPFFQLCTLTFLGQPRADLSCVPLSKHSLNLMDVPLLSSFVQSSIDAALAEYVAPKSLTLNLRDMLVGDDGKKDTAARGVVAVHVRRARGFKEGDGGLGPLVRGSSDAYVTVAWGKFGKPLASTRVIAGSQHPVWNEWAFVLVTADEINADETLRLQLWDADKHTADDDLGRVELPLREILRGAPTRNRMRDREDGLTRADDGDPDEKMPGTLAWAVGYFEKAPIQPRQLAQQRVDPDIRSLDALQAQVADQARWKLREADTDTHHQDPRQTKELRQQTLQDYRAKEEDMIVSAPPPDELRSGVVSVQIHNITGLEMAKLNRRTTQGGDGGGEADREDEAEQSDELPDSYCTVILNHRAVYRTRTKPKNAKPFFNAGTERFVRDWTTAELIVSVRDAREGERDPLLGVVYLPLARVFARRSQVMETYPLAGGIGYGRMRISLVWRSVQLRLPRELMGWDYGTVEAKVPLRLKKKKREEEEEEEEGEEDVSLQSCKIQLQTNLGRVKLKPGGAGDGGAWWPKKKRSSDPQQSVFLGVTKRYAQPLVVEFRRKSALGPDGSPAFGVFWLSDIPDEEERTVTIPIWRGGKDNLQRARSCYGYQGMEEGERPIGAMELTLKFWRGLSGYHKRYANKAQNSAVKDVMEVLDTVADEKMGVEEEQDDGTEPGSGSDSDSDFEEVFGGGRRSSSHEGEDEENENGSGKCEEREKKKMLRRAGSDSSSSDSDSDGPKIPMADKLKDQILTGGTDGKEDGSRGLRAQAQDYRQHRKSLHRKHRGVMQWKAARTLDWMADKAKQGRGKVEGVFEHGDKEQGIETEV